MFSIDKNGKIRLTKGDTATIKVEIIKADGKKYELQENDELTLSLKKNINQTEPEHCFLAQGYDIIIPPANDIDAGLYIYDVQLKTELGNIYTVAHGWFESFGEVSENE